MAKAMRLEMPPEPGMDIVVARFERVDECPGLFAAQVAESQLPDGFPFLLDTSSGQIVEPTFEYLFDRIVRHRAYYRGAGKKGPKNTLTLATAVTMADNLRLWWGYLAFRGLHWKSVTGTELASYARGLERVVSPRTGEALSDGTIRQRLTHVIEFYRWTNARGYTAIRSDELDEMRGGGKPSPAGIRAFTYDEWKTLRPLVGPLPSADEYHPRRAPCRDRLMWEVMLHAGLRRMEVCGLTVHQIRALAAKVPAAEDMFSARQIPLSIVKGGPGKARDAIFPVWLINEMLIYADGEERATAATAYARRHKGKEPNALFLNHSWSRRAPGAPMTKARVTGIFNQIMRRARFVRTVRSTDPDTGQVYARERATHCVHDIRHTAAVWRYMAERAGGNPAPWKPVQVMLGHKNEETTRGTYLQVTNLFEAQVSDAALRFFRGLAPGTMVGGKDESDL